MINGLDRRYPIEMEVAGGLAMFARPDTGATPTSYPAPTWSAAKGMFESIALLADGAAWICPIRVEICRPIGDAGGRINYQRFTTNYGGPLRKPSLLSKGTVSGGSSMQLFATAIAQPIYRVHGLILGNGSRGRVNRRHHLQDLFNRRLTRGQCFRVPRLGWSECVCSYWGPFRHTMTEVDTSLSMDVPSMMVGMWDHPTGGSYNPTFTQDARIGYGVLEYPLEYVLNEFQRGGEV